MKKEEEENKKELVSLRKRGGEGEEMKKEGRKRRVSLRTR